MKICIAVKILNFRVFSMLRPFSVNAFLLFIKKGFSMFSVWKKFSMFTLCFCHDMKVSRQLNDALFKTLFKKIFCHKKRLNKLILLYDTQYKKAEKLHLKASNSFLGLLFWGIHLKRRDKHLLFWFEKIESNCVFQAERIAIVKWKPNYSKTNILAFLTLVLPKYQVCLYRWRRTYEKECKQICIPETLLETPTYLKMCIFPKLLNNNK
jgi:hypothetical protein